MGKVDAGTILEGLAKLFKERQAVYKDNWKDIGPVLAGFFPRGVTLVTAQDHIRFHLFILTLVKLTRYTNNWERGHSDSLRDASVYLAMLDAADIKPGVPSHTDPVALALMEIADPYNHTVSGEARRKARAALAHYLKYEDIMNESNFTIWLDAHREGANPLPKYYPKVHKMEHQHPANCPGCSECTR